MIRGGDVDFWYRSSQAPLSCPPADPNQPKQKTNPATYKTNTEQQKSPLPPPPSLSPQYIATPPPREKINPYLGPEVLDVDVTLGVALHDHHLHARQDRGRRVRTVSGHGDDAHVAVAITAAAVVPADAQEPGVLALGPGVGLAGAGREAGDLSEVVVQAIDHLLVSLALASQIFFRFSGW